MTQETFLSAYQHLDEFEKDVEKAWLCRVASNKCIDYHRAAARRMVPTLIDDISDEKTTFDDDPLKSVLNREILEELKKSCENLSSPYRDIACKHFLEGKTAKEISEQSGVGLNTVKTQIHRAKNMLKKSYNKEGKNHET